MINRVTALLRFIFWVLSVLLFSTVLFIDYSPAGRSILTIVFIIASLVNRENYRCPHCRRYSLKSTPLYRSTPGCCPACGKRIEYSE